MEHAYLLDVITYYPDDGVFVWNYSKYKSEFWNSKYAGRPAGSIFRSQHGMLYWRVKMNFSNYLMHRLAWFYVTGKWPQPQIDHVDGDGLNNRWNNLREATQSQNFANRGSFERGAFYYPHGNRWIAKICIERKQHYLGIFETKELALAAYKQALLNNFGEFAIFNRR